MENLSIEEILKNEFNEYINQENDYEFLNMYGYSNKDVLLLNYKPNKKTNLFYRAYICLESDITGLPVIMIMKQSITKSKDNSLFSYRRSNQYIPKINSLGEMLFMKEFKTKEELMSYLKDTVGEEEYIKFFALMLLKNESTNFLKYI